MRTWTVVNGVGLVVVFAIALTALLVALDTKKTEAENTKLQAHKLTSLTNYVKENV